MQRRTRGSWLGSLYRARGIGLVVALVGALAFVPVGRAGAEPTREASAVAPSGVGFGNEVLWPAPMYSAPHFDTYVVGTAHPGDDVADLCYIDTVNGHFDLVLDRTGYGGDHYGNTAAFMSEWDLRRSSTTSCASVFPISNSSSATMRSAPYPNTYVVGQARSTDAILDICWLIGGDGFAWDMVLDRTGLGGNHYGDTAAFIRHVDLANPYAQTTPC